MLQARLDGLGHLANGICVIIIWGIVVGSLSTTGSVYYVAFSMSFIAPVLAEAVNPVDVDLCQLLSRPASAHFVFTCAHTGINCVDRVLSAASLGDRAQQAPVMEAVVAKCALLLASAACARLSLARALGLPVLSPNADLLARAGDFDQPLRLQAGPAAPGRDSDPGMLAGADWRRPGTALGAQPALAVSAAARADVRLDLIYLAFDKDMDVGGAVRPLAGAPDAHSEPAGLGTEPGCG